MAHPASARGRQGRGGGRPRAVPPWRQSASEGPPREGSRRLTALDIAVVVLVTAAIVAIAIWFLFISSGGIGPGTV